MKLLLDSHALFWSLLSSSRLSHTAVRAMASEDSEVYVSVATAWEMAIKVGLGKWPEVREIVDRFEQEIELSEFRLLPITVAHVRTAGLLKSDHRDPFDRLLAAQAMTEGLTLVTSDASLAGLGATCLW